MFRQLATKEYHNTKDILHVMEMLGHRSINYTLIYTHMLTSEKHDAYHSAIAKTVEEAQKLVESGFDYVTEVDGVKYLGRENNLILYNRFQDLISSW